MTTTRPPSARRRPPPEPEQSRPRTVVVAVRKIFDAETPEYFLLLGTTLFLVAFGLIMVERMRKNSNRKNMMSFSESVLTSASLCLFRSAI